MNEKHTSEPWGQARKDIIAPPLDASLLKADPEGNVVLVARFEREEDAERALICVNACADITTEALLDGAIEELVTALKAISESSKGRWLNTHQHDALVLGRNALIKLKGTA